ncbi:TELO2-interacting protein 2 [Aplysia californica]|uniref:TELO2-interacting protein 2 n=1 Tax=Aplysia californica TaxID=6500 RepID=A0ABM0JFC7_APLCA|nr:TELO2-interacting protein 2 [Aplysia californica]
MAGHSNESEPTSTMEPLVLPHVADKALSDITALLREASSTSCNEKKVKVLLKASGLIQELHERFTSIDADCVGFTLALQHVLRSCVVSTFSNRDYFSYSYEDFEGISFVSEAVLQVLVAVLVAAVKEKRAGENVPQLVELFCDEIVLDLLIIIGANIEDSLWSSVKASELSNEVLNNVLKLFSCETVNELLCMEVKTANHQNVKKVTLFSLFLSHSKDFLSKEQWQRNPYMCKVFCWFLSQAKFPLLSDHIDLILAVSLNFLLDHQELNKVQGLKVIHHLVLNVTSEEIRWYNRIEVVHQALNQQLHSKECLVLSELLPTLFASVCVLDKNTTSADYHCGLLETLLRNADMENLLVLRRLYMSNIKILIQQMGFPSAGKLGLILGVISNYLQIDDGSSDICRVKTLEVLQTIVEVAWPRIPPHRDTILKCLLKVLVDIQTLHYQETHSKEAQMQMKEKINGICQMLCKVCPSATKCFEALKDSNHVSHLLWT